MIDDELPPPAGRHDARSFASELVRVPWRAGRSVGRTVYAVLTPGEGGDVLIGLFDSAELAGAAVAAHNLTVGLSPPQG